VDERVREKRVGLSVARVGCRRGVGRHREKRVLFAVNPLVAPIVSRFRTALPPRWQSRGVDSKAVNIPSISIIAATAKRIGATVHGIVYPRFAVLHFQCARAASCNLLMVALTKSSHRRDDTIKRFEPHPYRCRVVGPIRGEEKIVCGENSYNTVL
jgi:hypothetical protein